ncbi:MAG: hypothetical protein ACYDCC_05475 [Actinomycetota bacterium]
MQTSPVKLGSMLFTIVEPHKGHEVAYNRWYERDHFYAGCMVGPGVLSGKRWVAPREYKSVRIGSLDKGSYLATYFISEDQSREWGAWAAKEVHALHKAGRMFAERDHVHTKMYRYEWGAFRDEDGVPPELALDHPYKGIAAILCEAPERGSALENSRLEITTEGSVAMCLAFTPVPIPDEAPADVPRIPDDAHRFLLLYFLEQDPLDAWESVAADAKALSANVLWAAPFIPTIPGTDIYTDQL